mmetsp:Transcript_41784/g.63815  ORF Transcript_41784/g.63815 Transcript_41784/m.63815 type:complete len:172 (+) Transcript_41784:2569-3084(+)
MQRRLSLAIALVSDPKIILLDEPTAGLDLENKRQIWDILKRIKAKRSILITTHIIEEANFLCDRVAIINKGVLRCIGSKSRLRHRYGSGFQLEIQTLNPYIISMRRRIAKRAARKLREQEETKEETKEQDGQLQVKPGPKKPPRKKKCQTPPFLSTSEERGGQEYIDPLLQ